MAKNKSTKKKTAGRVTESTSRKTVKVEIPTDFTQRELYILEEMGDVGLGDIAHGLSDRSGKKMRVLTTLIHIGLRRKGIVKTFDEILDADKYVLAANGKDIDDMSPDDISFLEDQQAEGGQPPSSENETSD